MNQAREHLMAEDPVDEAILAALSELTELPGPVLRERAAVSNDEFYAAILQLETDRKVKSRWAEDSGPKVRLYRLADVKVT